MYILLHIIVSNGAVLATTNEFDSSAYSAYTENYMCDHLFNAEQCFYLSKVLNVFVQQLDSRIYQENEKLREEIQREIQEELSQEVAKQYDSQSQQLSSNIHNFIHYPTTFNHSNNFETNEVDGNVVVCLFHFLCFMLCCMRHYY